MCVQPAYVMPSIRASANGLREQFSIRAVFIGSNDADYQHLRCIFRMMKWKLARVPALRPALRKATIEGTTHFFYKHVAGDNRGWIEALNAVRSLPHMPAFILTSRLADEQLWAEVLNRGGYDLLIQPYDSMEVTRVVEAARRHSLQQNVALSALAG